MNARRITATVGATLLLAVLATGCRTDGAVTSAPPGSSSSTSDPLSSIDSTLDTIEHDLDTDAATG